MFRGSAALKCCIVVLTVLLFLAILPEPAPFPHDGLHEKIAKADAAIREDPGDAGLYLKRAELYRLHKDWQRSEADLIQAEALSPQLSELDFVRGKLRHDMGRMDEAFAALSRHLKVNSRNVAAYVLRGDIQAAQGKPEGAICDYSQAIALGNPPRPEHYTTRAAVVFSQGPEHAAAAIRGLEEGMARLGSPISLVLAAVDLEVATGRYDDALARIQVLAEQARRKEPWLARRGDILAKAGDEKKARAAYQECLRLIADLPIYLQSKRATRQLAHETQIKLNALAR